MEDSMKIELHSPVCLIYLLYYCLIMSDVRYKVLWRTTDWEDLIVQISPAFFELIRNWWNPKGSYNTSNNSVGLGQMLWEKPRWYAPRSGARTGWYQWKPTWQWGSRPPRDRNWGWNKPREYIRRGWGSEIKL